MEVVVHGTNGGYRILYKTQGAPSIASDIRNNAESKTSLGKSAYGVSFVANGCVFSKYKIVKDALRNNATGFIAFSLFLPIGEKLSGVEIKSILDKLQSYYVDNYIINNQMNQGERTQIIQEDWTFLNNILNKYTTTNDVSRSQLQPGTKEAAFIYYKDDVELIEYLDKPFQEEYCDYKQVLFIDIKLRENCDVLNVLRNSGVELKNIDLKNEYYYLNNYDRNKGITVTANGKPRLDGKGNNLIRSKDKVEISYNKNEKFYFPIEANGILSDPSSKIHKYLDIRSNQISINYAAFINPEPRIKTITIDIRDRNGIPISDAEIKCDGNYTFKTIDNNQITFTGEDIGKRWTVSAKKGDNLFLDNHLLDFQRDCPGDTGTVKLQLNERRTVSFIGKINGISVTDINVSIESKSKKLSKSTFEFLNDEIGRTYKVTATYHKNNEKFSGEKTFCPKDSDTVHINLQVVKVEEYSIDIGKYGKENQSLPGYSNSKTGKDVESYIKPKRGWKFTGFKLEKSPENNGYDGILVAQYKKNHKPVIVSSIILSVLIISAGVYWFWPKEEIKKALLTESRIEKYVNGIELNLDTLARYKTEWKTQHSEVKKEGNTVWYNPITWISNEDEDSKFDESDNWKKTSESIDRAIKKRISIDNWNFEVLKDSTRYFNDQLKFKNVVVGIDITKYDTIQKRFSDVSKWNLIQIADSINVFLNPIEPEINNSLKNTNEAAEVSTSKSGGNDSTSDKSKKDDSKSTTENNTEQTQTKKTGKQNNNNNNSELKKALQSSTITTLQLKEYQKKPGDYKKSIDLYLEFWELVKASNQKTDFDILLGKVKKDSTLKNSELKKLLDSICKNSETFKKYLVAPGRAITKTLNELNDKIK